MTMKIFSLVLCVLVVNEVTKGQSSVLKPTGCLITVNGGSPVNGSLSDTMNCTSGVLFNSDIPTLTGLDGNTWAHELVTIKARDFTNIELMFSEGSAYGMGGRVEVVLFNCPKWDIKASTISLSAGGREISQLDIVPTSCNSLVRVCMHYFICDLTSPMLMQIIGLGNTTNSWVHLAEVSFYNGSSSTRCPPDAVLNPQQHSSTGTTLATSATSPERCTVPTVAGLAPSTTSMSCLTSNILTSVVTVIITALLTTAANILVHLAICKCHSKPLQKAELPPGAKGGGGGGDVEGEYVQMNGTPPTPGVEKEEYVEMSMVVKEPTYQEIGSGNGVKTHQGNYINAKAVSGSE